MTLALGFATYASDDSKVEGDERVTITIRLRTSRYKLAIEEDTACQFVRKRISCIESERTRLGAVRIKGTRGASEHTLLIPR